MYLLFKYLAVGQRLALRAADGGNHEEQTDDSDAGNGRFWICWNSIFRRIWFWRMGCPRSGGRLRASARGLCGSRGGVSGPGLICQLWVYLDWRLLLSGRWTMGLARWLLVTPALGRSSLDCAALERWPVVWWALAAVRQTGPAAKPVHPANGLPLRHGGAGHVPAPEAAAGPSPRSGESVLG